MLITFFVCVWTKCTFFSFFTSKMSLEFFFINFFGYKNASKSNLRETIIISTISLAKSKPRQNKRNLPILGETEKNLLFPKNTTKNSL